MAEIVCPHCHTAVPRDAGFCPGCRSLIGKGGITEDALVPARSAPQAANDTARDVVEEAVRSSMARPKTRTASTAGTGADEPVDPYPTDEQPRRSTTRREPVKRRPQPATDETERSVLARVVAFFVTVPHTLRSASRKLGALPVTVLVVVCALLGSGGLLYSVGAFDQAAMGSNKPAAAKVLVPVAHEASCAAPPSVTSAGKKVTFGAGHLLDGKTKTAWRCAGDGSKQRVRLSFGEPVRVSKLALVPGWATKDPTSRADRFKENGAPTAVRWRFDDSVQRQRIGKPKPAWATVRLDPTVRTKSVTLLIDSVREGERRAMVAVSEIRVHGYRS